MRLKTLNISNFKGLRKFTFQPDGRSANIYGANAIGKSTLADAISWLLFDKDQLDRSPLAFGLKTRDEYGNELQGEEHTVEAEFILDNQGLVLKKIYKEKRTTTRGTSEEKLRHTTDYFYDGEPVKASEYTSRLYEIVDETLLKILTIPGHLTKLHWKEIQGILFDLLDGSVSDEDIIAGHPELSGYMDMLDGKTKEARQNILTDRRKNLNKELNSIPDRIDENQMKITDPEETAESAEKSVAILKENINGKLEKISQINAGGGVADMQVKLQGIEAEKQKAQNEHNAKIGDLTSGKRDKVFGLSTLVDGTQNIVRDLRTKYSDAEVEVNNAYNRVKKVEDLIDQEKSKQPEPPKDENEDGPDTCPMCEQPMPEKDPADVKAQYNKYLERFNSAKAEELKRLNEVLADAQSVLKEKQEAFESLKEEGIKAKGQLDQRQQALEKAQKDLKEIELPAFDATPFDEKKQALQKKIDELHGTRKEQVDAIRTEIIELEQEVETHKKVISQHQQNKELRDRIAELKEQMKRYGDELNQVEKDLMMIEDYNRARAELITDRINSKFDLVKWRLFKEQVNGGLAETADPMVNGVPFNEGLNNAARIAAGLDIINTLSKHYGISLPVFVDNAEAITEMPEYEDLQVIALYVSAEDKTLRVELEDESKMAVA